MSRRFGAPRETEIAQQAGPAIADGATAIEHVGYFIVTVSGPRVTVTYYAAPVKATLGGFGWAIRATSTLSFTRQETFGYSLNGKEFFVPEGGSYRVADRFKGTKAEILGGVKAEHGHRRRRPQAHERRDHRLGRPRPPTAVSRVASLRSRAFRARRAASDTYTLALSTTEARPRRRPPRPL